MGSVREFLEAFEEVFHADWKYTKSMLGIQDATPEQAAAAAQMGLERMHVIAPDGTFLQPGVADEVEDWGNRARLLQCYRALREALDRDA